MSEWLRVGSCVRLTSAYMRYATADVQKAFSGKLTIIASQGDVYRLSNGAQTGLTHLTVTSSGWLTMA